MTVEELLKSAEELVESKEAHDQLLEAIDQAERLLPDDPSLLCRTSRLLYRHGVLNSRGRFLLLALEKLKYAQEKNPLFFEHFPEWFQLWGNILIQLSKLLNDPSFLEMAINKYEKAAKTPELYWDWGEAWVLLGQKSGEVADFQQGLMKFHLAKGGIRSFFFKLDYAAALLHYGQLVGDPLCFEEAIALFRGVITDAYRPDPEGSIPYILGWRKCALALKGRFELTHRKEHFDEAETGFREAILATSKNGELWLDWAGLYLQAGWIKRDLKLIEAGLEKLTAFKIKECDPLKASCLLGMGLVIYGLFLENLKLLKEGKERITKGLEYAPRHRHLVFASGFADLALALYFSDEAAFSKVAAFFERGIEEDATAVAYWHVLFQTYLAWGMKMGDPFLIKKGIRAIARLCELRPSSPVYLNEWGVALLRLRQLECGQNEAQGYIEEAVIKFRKAAELEGDEDTLYNWGCALDLLGNLTADEGNYEKAIDLLAKALEKKPSELHVRYHLGLALSHLGTLTLNGDYLKQAAGLIEMVAKIDQDNERVWCDLGYTLLNLSELIFDAAHPEEGEKIRCEAEKALTHAAELGNGDACYHLACLYSLSGYYTASLEYLKKAELVGCLPAFHELESDEWLEGIRATDAYRVFLLGDEDG